MTDQASKHKVLWIEDDSFGDLAEQLGPVYVDGKYDVVVALDATKGYEHLMQTQFAAVIVDIRLGPGDHEKWISIYKESKKDKATGRLGLHLLREVICDETKRIRPEVFGVFTVESKREVESDLTELGINMNLYRHKSEGASNSYTLLELIDAVISNTEANKESQ